MTESASQSTVFTYTGGPVAVIGRIGSVVFGWRFGETERFLSRALGVVLVLIAVAVVLDRVVGATI